MQTPELVAENVKAMMSAVDIPVTVKCRIGVDEQEPRESLWRLVELSAEAGCETFLVHARKAWLKGLSPKQNRDVPPLDYPLVYELKRAFPELEIVINGGVTTIEQCQEHLEYVDGVMMGREAYSNPYILASVDDLLYGDERKPLSRDEVLQAYTQYISDNIREGVRLTAQHGQTAIAAFPDLSPAEAMAAHIAPSNLERLRIWCSVGADAPNGLWAIYGARLGVAMAALDCLEAAAGRIDFERLRVLEK